MSDKAGRTTQTQASTSLPKGNNYLLAIGIDAYQYCPRLRNCAKDVQDFITVLQQRFNFDATYTHTLFNTEATRKNILKAFREVQARIQPQDNLVVYFSGHGDTVHQLGYWIPVEAQPGEEDEYISAHEIVERLNAIPTFHTFLIVDACFSGALFQTTKNIAPPTRSDEAHRSRWGLTASHSRELALDGTKGDNSPFAECLLLRLRQTPEALSVHDLSTFVINEVRRRTRETQTPIAQPLPVRGHELGQFVFHLKKDEARDFIMAQKENTITAYEHFLKMHPGEGKYQTEARAAIATLKAEQAWNRIATMPEEKEYQIQEKLRAIYQYLTNFPSADNLQVAENDGKQLKYKQDFVNAYNNLFALREFARQHTPFRDAATKRIAELEAELYWEDPEVEKRKAAEIRRQAEEKAAQEEAERKRRKEQQQQEAMRRQAQERQTIYGEPPIYSGTPPPRKKNYLPYGIGAALSFIIILMIWQPWKSDTVNLTDPTTTQQQDNSSSYEPEMVAVTGGTFMMGCKDGRDSDCSDDEKPPHAVTVKDFSIGKYEVTVAQFKAFIDDTAYQTDADKKGSSYIWTGSEWKDTKGVNWLCDVGGKIRPQSEYNHPVIHVSWNDAVAYAKWLSEKTNKTYRLPTEAEWEYAARGGNKSKGFTYAGSDKLDEVGWYYNNSGSKTHPVGQKLPNELGLYDMSGNVWEWVEDCWNDSYQGAPTDGSAWLKGDSSRRVVRGGALYNVSFNCRVSYRLRYYTVDQNSDVGFRVLRD